MSKTKQNKTKRKIQDTDTYVAAANIFATNNDNQNWGATSQSMAFTAQTTLAASYGLLQVMYTSAIYPMSWKGINGARNPSYLFDTATNIGDGGGSLELGSSYLVHVFSKANPNLLLGKESEFMAAFINAFVYYNAGRNRSIKTYGTTVINNSKDFLPVPSSKIFE